MLQKLYDWIDDRVDVTPIWRDIADHEVPEHVNPAYHFSAFVYCFGGLTFFVVVIQVLSGMFLTMYYVPDIENAWHSVYYLQSQVAHGQIVRDRKSTRLNSSHVAISYAVFCLKQKKA